MDLADQSNRSVSNARPLAETSWPIFVDTYGRIILEWFRQANLPATEIFAIVREMMTSIYGEFAQVGKEPDLKFRAWLQFAAHAGWCQLMENRVETGADGKPTPTIALLLSVEAHDAFLKTLDNECGRQRRAEILHRAQPLVNEIDWEVFRRGMLLHEPVNVMAQEFQCRETAVGAAMYRVQCVLLDELARMEESI
jgi:hypothetical protein